MKKMVILIAASIILISFILYFGMRAVDQYVNGPMEKMPNIQALDAAATFRQQR